MNMLAADHRVVDRNAMLHRHLLRFREESLTQIPQIVATLYRFLSLDEDPDDATCLSCVVMAHYPYSSYVNPRLRKTMSRYRSDFGGAVGRGLRGVPDPKSRSTYNRAWEIMMNAALTHDIPGFWRSLVRMLRYMSTYAVGHVRLHPDQLERDLRSILGDDWEEAMRTLQRWGESYYRYYPYGRTAKERAKLVGA